MRKTRAPRALGRGRGAAGARSGPPPHATEKRRSEGADDRSEKTPCEAQGETRPHPGGLVSSLRERTSWIGRLVVAGAAGGVATAMADDTQWTGGNGRWTDAAKWTAGVPTVEQAADVSGNSVVTI